LNFFLVFPFAFISFPLITHFRFSLLENDLYFSVCLQNIWDFSTKKIGNNFSIFKLIPIPLKSISILSHRL
jgi:hypothetical protein